MSRSDQQSEVLDAILRFNQGRKPKRVRTKLQRMDEGAFPFFRGTAHLFARAWPELKPADAGPAVLLCGDLHLENFGAYRSDNGDYLFDINDFDEALVAPVGVDLVRCAASILLAAEQWRLSPLRASGMVLAYLDQYRSALTRPPRTPPVSDAAPHLGRGAVWDLLGATALGSNLALLNHHTAPTKGGTRRIVRTKLKRPAIGVKRAEQVRQAVEQYGAATAKPEAYKVHDVSGRIAGIGSLGLRRYLVLIEGEGSPDRNRLLDIKDARPSSLLACAPEVPQPDFGGNEARRVVEAQRTLQAEPIAGLDVLAIEGESFRMREMIPEENRSSLDRFQKQPDKLREAVEVAGRLTAWSHLRGAQQQHRGAHDHHADTLLQWVAGAALDSLFAASARFAERTRVEYEEFHRVLRQPGALPRPMRPKGTARRT